MKEFSQRRHLFGVFCLFVCLFVFKRLTCFQPGPVCRVLLDLPDAFLVNLDAFVDKCSIKSCDCTGMVAGILRQIQRCF